MLFQTTFEDFLKQSDLDKEIEWLKNTDLEISMSNVEKFDYGKIKKLLEEGLISLTITQEY